MKKKVDATFQRKGLHLPTKCHTPMSTDYLTNSDVTDELKSDGVQYSQELIGILRWTVELGRVDILIKAALMVSTYMALDLIQLYRMFGFLKRYPKRKLAFDPNHPVKCERMFKQYDWFDIYCDSKEPIPGDMSQSRGNPTSIHCFVDTSHVSDCTTRLLQTGILIFCSKAPIIWMSLRQNTVEASTFGSKFQAMKNAKKLMTLYLRICRRQNPH